MTKTVAVIMAGLLAVMGGLYWLYENGSTAGTGPGDLNVIVIYSDDLGYGDLSSYGHLVLKTPHIDELAEEGLKLTAYYAPSPLCSPSRASMLTGRMPYRTGIRSWIPQGSPAHLSADERTMATLLKEQGYDTAVIGKWHINGGLEKPEQTQPQDHGFDYSFLVHAFPLPNQKDPENFYRNGEPVGPLQGFTAELVVDEALGWLDERAGGERPFFLYLPFIEPHGTIASPDRWLEEYSDYTRGEPVPFPNGLPEPPEGLEARGPGEYYANVAFFDAQIGRLMAYLDEAGLEENTLIVFLSDNGPVTDDWRNWWEINLYGETGGFRGRKADLYEGGIRVPGILRLPGRIPAGAVSDAPVHGYDILPTVAALTDMALPDDRPIDGIDISPLFEGETLVREKPLFWAFAATNGLHYAVRDGKWKMLADESMKPVALYDLEADRFETYNRIAAEPEIAKALGETLRALMQDVHDDPYRPDWDVEWAVN